MTACTCAKLSVGDAKNLDENCLEHGIGTEYYNTVIADSRARSIELQGLAKTARDQYAKGRALGYAAALADVAAWHEREAALFNTAARGSIHADVRDMNDVTAMFHGDAAESIRAGRVPKGRT